MTKKISIYNKSCSYTSIHYNGALYVIMGPHCTDLQYFIVILEKDKLQC